MLFVAWTNAENCFIGLQNVFLAQKLVSLLAAGIGARHFSGKTLSALLGYATLHGIHLQEFAGLIRFKLFGVSRSGYRQHKARDPLRTHTCIPHRNEPRF